jgi:dolichol-phosphate mannosyltransferase
MAKERRMPELGIVVPVHNESENVQEFYGAVVAACKDLDFEILFVNDGSTDNTALQCRKLAESDLRVHLISFVKNAGHQIAIHAGLSYARGEFVAMMDGDLQHPPDYLPIMVECARREGVDVVNMVKRRYKEGLIKRAFSALFYRLFNSLTGGNLVPGASDFRLFTHRVHRVLLSLSERRPFYRAMIPALGFPYKNLEFDVPPRHAGTSSYTFLKSARMASEAFLYHSTLPLHLMIIVGVLVASGAFIYAIISIIVRLAGAERIRPGWADIIVSVLMLGGLNLTLSGLIGKYIALLLEHEKRRPAYIVDEKLSTIQEPPEVDCED